MGFLCYKRGCSAEEHLAEYEYAMANFGIEKVRGALVEFSPEQMLLLQKIRLNWLNTKNVVYAFLSGSVVVDCIWEESMCKLLEHLRDIGCVERRGTAYYIPHTLLSEEVVENLPLPEITEEDYEIKKHYVVSMRGISGEADILEAMASFFERATVFMGRKLAKVVRGVPYIPQLANKYTERVDILLKGADNSLTGFGYFDVRGTHHLGFTKAKSLLSYGLDYVVLLHPFVDHAFHREVANRIKNRWDIYELGYAAVNLMEEELYLYKLPGMNRYLKMSPSAHKYSSIIRGYIETL